MGPWETLWIVLGAAITFAAALRRGRRSSKHLGFVSREWIAKHADDSVTR